MSQADQFLGTQDLAAEDGAVGPLGQRVPADDPMDEQPEDHAQHQRQPMGAGSKRPRSSPSAEAEGTDRTRGNTTTPSVPFQLRQPFQQALHEGTQLCRTAFKQRDQTAATLASLQRMKETGKLPNSVRLSRPELYMQGLTADTVSAAQSRVHAALAAAEQEHMAVLIQLAEEAAVLAAAQAAQAETTALQLLEKAASSLPILPPKFQHLVEQLAEEFELSLILAIHDVKDQQEQRQAKQAAAATKKAAAAEASKEQQAPTTLEGQVEQAVKQALKPYQQQLAQLQQRARSRSPFPSRRQQRQQGGKGPRKQRGGRSRKRSASAPPKHVTWADKARGAGPPDADGWQQQGSRKGSRSASPAPRNDNRQPQQQQRKHQQQRGQQRGNQHRQQQQQQAF